MTLAMPSPDLAARTLELVDMPSESRHERAGDGARPRASCPARALYDDGEAIVWGDPAAPVALAGHLDTVPAQGNVPGRIDDGAVHGLGASDMKGGVAVMLELARAEARRRGTSSSRARRSPLEESPLPGVFESGVLAGVELAVVLEPTDCILHAGCLGNLQARVDFHGESAHSARPWTGRNAIHALVEGLGPVAALEPLEVELDGLVYREVLSVVRVEGGIAQNVVPAPRLGGAQLPLRAGPVARRGRGAAARARARGRAPRPPQLAGRAARARGTRTSRGCASSSPTSRRSRRGRRSRSSPSRASTRSTTARARRRTRTGGRADPDREPAHGVRHAG